MGSAKWSSKGRRDWPEVVYQAEVQVGLRSPPLHAPGNSPWGRIARSSDRAQVIFAATGKVVAQVLVHRRLVTVPPPGAVVVQGQVNVRVEGEACKVFVALSVFSAGQV